jgi:hypothetical protein
VADATCCGSVAAAASRGSSLVVAAVLPVTLGALDESPLVGTDASDLSALAGARGGRSAPPCKYENKKIRLLPQNWGTRRGDCLPQGGEALLPLPQGLDGRCGGGRRHHCRAPRRLRSVRRCLRDARCPFCRPPGGRRFRACPRRLLLCHLSGSRCGGRRIPPLRGACPCRFLPLLPLPTTSTTRSPRERAPAARAAGIPCPAVPGALAARTFAPSCVPPALAPVTAPRTRGLGAWAGRTARRSRPPSARKSEMSELQRRITEE